MFLMPFSLQHITHIKVTLNILKFHWPKITIIIYKSNVKDEQIYGVISSLIKANKTSWSKPSLQIGYNDHFRIHSPFYQNTFVSATIHKSASFCCCVVCVKSALGEGETPGKEGPRKARAILLVSKSNFHVTISFKRSQGPLIRPNDQAP